MHVVESSRQVGWLVKKNRREAHLTQKQLAKLAGVSERLVIALELGDAQGIQFDKLLKVLSALGLSLAVLGAVDDVESFEKPEGHIQYAVVGFSDYPINLDLPPELMISTQGGSGDNA